MYKILSVEDDSLLLETLEDYLLTQNYNITCARNAKQALDICYKEKFDIYIWDINLPDINGLTCLQMLRDSGDKTPAIFLTSATDKTSVQKGFLVGGDDYIKKPFDLDELNLRIRAVLKRSGIEDKNIQINSTYSINPARKTLYKNGSLMHLNPKDFMLLSLLVENQDKIVTKEMIEGRLWTSNENIHDGAIRVYINNLKKIFGKKSIKNIRGVGYKFYGQ